MLRTRRASHLEYKWTLARAPWPGLRRPPTPARAALAATGGLGAERRAQDTRAEPRVPHRPQPCSVPRGGVCTPSDTSVSEQSLCAKWAHVGIARSDLLAASWTDTHSCPVPGLARPVCRLFRTDGAACRRSHAGARAEQKRSARRPRSLRREGARPPLLPVSPLPFAPFSQVPSTPDPVWL